MYARFQPLLLLYYLWPQDRVGLDMFDKHLPCTMGQATNRVLVKYCVIQAIIITELHII